MNVQQTVVPTLLPSISPSPTLTPSPAPDTSKVVMENEAFRIFEPAPNAEVGTTFTVKGQARVFEAAFSYSFEDGHKVLSEGNVKAAAGAPEWADFEYTVTYEKPSNPVGALIIFEKSAKDGASTNQLMIPLKFNPDIIEPLQ
ncbi:sporulation protein [Paenibacillus psychroresistens]|uniref:Sporulation protein n=2 Tax=Paenibacillus psychroresistens TaxID=1778678 RepID=A0A6B8RWV3_9BACL|nr:sporulation protein [Paenibacillus psychroresistens]